MEVCTDINSSFEIQPFSSLTILPLQLLKGENYKLNVNNNNGPRYLEIVPKQRGNLTP